MKKNSKAQALTVEIFDSRLKNLKDEIAEEVDGKVFRLGLEMDRRFTEVDEKAQEYRDQILTGIDKVVKRLDNMDANDAARDQEVADVKVRVTSLEQHKN